MERGGMPGMSEGQMALGKYFFVRLRPQTDRLILDVEFICLGEFVAVQPEGLAQGR